MGGRGEKSVRFVREKKEWQKRTHVEEVGGTRVKTHRNRLVLSVELDDVEPSEVPFRV